MGKGGNSKAAAPAAQTEKEVSIWARWREGGVMDQS